MRAGVHASVKMMADILGESWHACRLSCSLLLLGFVSHTRWKGLCVSCRASPSPTDQLLLPSKQGRNAQTKVHAHRPSKVFPEGRVGTVLSSFPPLQATHEFLVLMETLPGFRVVEGGEERGGESPLGSAQIVLQSSCNLNGLPGVLLVAAQL